MLFIKERVGELISDVKELIYTQVTPIESYRFQESGERYEDVAGTTTKEPWKVVQRPGILPLTMVT